MPIGIAGATGCSAHEHTAPQLHAAGARRVRRFITHHRLVRVAAGRVVVACASRRRSADAGAALAQPATVSGSGRGRRAGAAGCRRAPMRRISSPPARISSASARSTASDDLAPTPAIACAASIRSASFPASAWSTSSGWVKRCNLDQSFGSSAAVFDSVLAESGSARRRCARSRPRLVGRLARS